METLSDKITTEIFVGNGCIDESDYPILEVKDVKEFIRKLKLEVTRKPVLSSFDYPMTIVDVPGVIDELAGDKLTGKPLDLSGGRN